MGSNGSLIQHVELNPDLKWAASPDYNDISEAKYMGRRDTNIVHCIKDAIKAGKVSSKDKKAISALFSDWLFLNQGGIQQVLEPHKQTGDTLQSIIAAANAYAESTIQTRIDAYLTGHDLTGHRLFTVFDTFKNAEDNTLVSATFAKDVLTVPSYSFLNNKALTTVIILNPKANVQKYAFEGCINLKQVIAAPTCTIQDEAFPKGVEIITFEVPLKETPVAVTTAPAPIKKEWTTNALHELIYKWLKKEKLTDEEVEALSTFVLGLLPEPLLRNVMDYISEQFPEEFRLIKSEVIAVKADFNIPALFTRKTIDALIKVEYPALHEAVMVVGWQVILSEYATKYSKTLSFKDTLSYINTNCMSPQLIDVLKQVNDDFDSEIVFIALTRQFSLFNKVATELADSTPTEEPKTFEDALASLKKDIIGELKKYPELKMFGSPSFFISKFMESPNSLEGFVVGEAKAASTLKEIYKVEHCPTAILPTAFLDKVHQLQTSAEKPLGDEYMVILMAYYKEETLDHMQKNITSWVRGLVTSHKFLLTCSLTPLFGIRGMREWAPYTSWKQIIALSEMVKGSIIEVIQHQAPLFEKLLEQGYIPSQGDGIIPSMIKIEKVKEEKEIILEAPAIDTLTEFIEENLQFKSCINANQLLMHYNPNVESLEDFISEEMVALSTLTSEFPTTKLLDQDPRNVAFCCDIVASLWKGEYISGSRDIAKIKAYLGQRNTNVELEQECGIFIKTFLSYIDTAPYVSRENDILPSEFLLAYKEKPCEVVSLAATAEGMLNIGWEDVLAKYYEYRIKGTQHTTAIAMIIQTINDKLLLQSESLVVEDSEALPLDHPLLRWVSNDTLRQTARITGHSFASIIESETAAVTELETNYQNITPSTYPEVEMPTIVLALAHERTKTISVEQAIMALTKTKLTPTQVMKLKTLVPAIKEETTAPLTTQEKIKNIFEKSGIKDTAEQKRLYDECLSSISAVTRKNYPGTEHALILSTLTQFLEDRMLGKPTTMAELPYKSFTLTIADLIDPLKDRTQASDAWALKARASVIFARYEQENERTDFTNKDEHIKYVLDNFS